MTNKLNPVIKTNKTFKDNYKKVWWPTVHLHTSKTVNMSEVFCPDNSYFYYASFLFASILPLAGHYCIPAIFSKLFFNFPNIFFISATCMKSDCKNSIYACMFINPIPLLWPLILKRQRQILLGFVLWDWFK